MSDKHKSRGKVSNGSFFAIMLIFIADFILAIDILVLIIYVLSLILSIIRGESISDIDDTYFYLFISSIISAAIIGGFGEVIEVQLANKYQLQQLNQKQDTIIKYLHFFTSEYVTKSHPETSEQAYSDNTEQYTGQEYEQENNCNNDSMSEEPIGESTENIDQGGVYA